MKSGKRARPVLVILGLAGLVLLAPGVSAQEAPVKTGTWTEVQAELKDFWPRQVKALQLRSKRMKIVRRPRNALDQYPAEPELWRAMTAFYDYIKVRELDVYEEIEKVPEFFPDRDAYYNFLDTMLPAMRDRKFERNRILDYRIHAITPAADDPARVEALVSFTSDDILPFGKLLVCRQQWRLGVGGWYPGKVSAEPATWWERVR